MLEMAPDDGIRLWDMLDMELEDTLINGKAVLIGDAAHPFLPCGFPRSYQGIKAQWLYQLSSS